VKEVEVFDKKSDQAVFTGIDDGVKDKTINLKLKENAKKGYFGKIEAGTDFSNYYNNSAMANAFKGKRKIAAYGIMSNTGQTNLDWKDNQNYGSDNSNIEMMDGGGIMITNEGDGDSYYNGRGGIPQNWNGGFHYSNKFNNSKQSVNAGYKITKVNSPNGQRNYSTYFTGDSSYNSNSVTEGFSSKIKQSLNLTFEANLDSNNSIKFTARGNLNNTKSNSNYSQESVTDKLLMINGVNRKTSSDVDNSSLNSSLLWKHKFKKLARTLTFNLSYNLSDSKNENFLYSQNDYFKGGLPDRNDTIDQKNIRDNKNNTLAANATYTEPLSKEWFLSFTYVFSRSSTTNDRFSFSKDINSNYNNRIDSLSNAYVFTQTNNRPGISIRMVKKKYNFSLGSAVSISHFEQDNRTTNQVRKYNFTNFFPTASLYVKLKGYSGIRFNYNGSTKAPSLDQLQPITDNTDQLNQYIGNPDLKQAFTHSINLNYNFYNVLQEKGLWAGIYGNFTQNAFVNDRTLDGFGRSTYKTVNANGNYYFGLYSSYNFKIKKPNIHINFGPNANVSRNVSYFNNQTAINTNSSYGVQFGIRKEKENKYEVSINPQITRVNAKSTLNTNSLANYWQGSINGNVKVTLPAKFRIETEVNFSAKEVDPRFPAKNKFTIWNTALKRNIFKDKLEASVSVNDILNERRGYERNFNEFQYSETFYNTLKRYWMFTLTWNFSKNGKPTNGF
ncbi:MAG: outer membrane beta-barrel family protein, partial [Ferruginibacter sp.]